MLLIITDNNGAVGVTFNRLAEIQIRLKSDSSRDDQDFNQIIVHRNIPMPFHFGS